MARVGGGRVARPAGGGPGGVAERRGCVGSRMALVPGVRAVRPRVLLFRDAIHSPVSPGHRCRAGERGCVRPRVLLFRDAIHSPVSPGHRCRGGERGCVRPSVLLFRDAIHSPVSPGAHRKIAPTGILRRPDMPRMASENEGVRRRAATERPRHRTARGAPGAADRVSRRQRGGKLRASRRGPRGVAPHLSPESPGRRLEARTAEAARTSLASRTAGAR
jgi:hypothetical protein